MRIAHLFDALVTIESYKLERQVLHIKDISIIPVTTDKLEPGKSSSSIVSWFVNHFNEICILSSRSAAAVRHHHHQPDYSLNAQPPPSFTYALPPIQTGNMRKSTHHNLANPAPCLLCLEGSQPRVSLQQLRYHTSKLSSRSGDVGSKSDLHQKGKSARLFGHAPLLPSDRQNWDCNHARRRPQNTAGLMGDLPRVHEHEQEPGTESKHDNRMKQDEGRNLLRPRTTTTYIYIPATMYLRARRVQPTHVHAI